MGDSKVHPVDTTVDIPAKENTPTHFQVQWDRLNYTVNKNWLERKISQLQGQKDVPASKLILNNVSGSFSSGQLVAMMGPSGAGKSTLLECIAGIRVKGRSGQIRIANRSGTINMAFIPQHDSYFGVLTVRETLLFASKLQNSTAYSNSNGDYLNFTITENEENGREAPPPRTGKRAQLKRQMTISNENFHEVIARNVMQVLGIDKVADVPTDNISGGQKKRLSIAQELVSKPDILILDEPTSGLDSSASFQCVQLLQKLTQQKLPMAIALTIHQPNPKTFNLFHKVYMLSVLGKCIYDGPPANLLETLNKVNLTCPSFYNPADFVLEVASGEHGTELIEKLVSVNVTAKINDSSNKESTSSWRDFDEVKIKPNFPFFKHFAYLFHRSLILILRNPMLTAMRLFSHLLLALFIGYIYGPSVGKASGCPPNIDGGFSPDTFKTATNASYEEAKAMMDNFSCIFFSMMILMFAAMMPTIITFPIDMMVFVKEKRNNWYGVGSYFLGFLVADTPFHIIFPGMYVVITYLMTSQIQVFWRFEAYLFICILIAMIGQCHGLIVGAVFMKNVTAAVYVGPLSALPLLLFSGFLVKIETMPAILRPFTFLSHLRFGFEGVMVAIYGYDRCGMDVQAKIETMRRMLLSWFSKMLSIVNDVMNEDNEEDNEFLSSHNLTLSKVDDKMEQKKLTEALVDTLIAGVGGGMKNSKGEVVSGVMSLFDLEDDHLQRSIIALAVFFLVFRLSTYFVVLWRSNTTK